MTSDPLLFGRTFEQAVADVLDDLDADPILAWVGADAATVAAYIDYIVGIGSAAHVAEALWRHYERLNPVEAA